MSLVVRPVTLDWNANKRLDIGDVTLQESEIQAMKLPQPVATALNKTIISSAVGEVLGETSPEYVADLAFWENWALQAFKNALGNGDLNHNGRIDIGDLVLAYQLASRIAREVPHRYRHAVAELLRSVASTVMSQLLEKQNTTPQEVAQLVDTIARKAGSFLQTYYNVEKEPTPRSAMAAEEALEEFNRMLPLPPAPP